MHFQEALSGLWSTAMHANTTLYPSAHGGRAGCARSRPPLGRGLDGPRLAASAGQGRGPAQHHPGTPPAGPRADGPPGDSRLPAAGAERPPPDSIQAPAAQGRLRPPEAGASADLGAPEPSPVWSVDPWLDAGVGRGGPLCPGPDAAPGQWRGEAPRPQARRGPLAAGHTREHQPRPRLPQQTHRRDRLLRRAAAPPTWARGWAEEGWGSRLAPPAPHRWAEAAAVTRRQALPRTKGAPEPHALAGAGRLVRRRRPPAAQLWLRLGAGRPVSAVTPACLPWGGERVAEHGITALRLIGAHASGPPRQAGRSWRRLHPQQVNTRQRGGRLVASWGPVNRPWLPPIAPQGGPGTRAVSEPARRLSAAELEPRVWTSDRCPPAAQLSMPQKVA